MNAQKKTKTTNREAATTTEAIATTKPSLVAIGAELQRKLKEKREALAAASRKRPKGPKAGQRVTLLQDMIAVPPDARLQLTLLGPEAKGWKDRAIDGVLKRQRMGEGFRKALLATKDEEALRMLDEATIKKGTEVLLLGVFDCWAYEYKGAKEDEPKERSARRLVVEVGGQLLAAYPDMVKVVEEQSTDGEA